MNYFKKKKQKEVLYAKQQDLKQSKIYLKLTREMINEYDKNKEEKDRMIIHEGD